jgi:predicted RNA-binding Zn-ribbon protein involved in translation (DUF1610 family)
MAILKFKCPKCGDDTLSSIEHSVERYRISSITDNKDDLIQYNDKCDVLDHYKVHFCCGLCGLVLLNNDQEVDNEEDLVKWIKKHCPQ